MMTLMKCMVRRLISSLLFCCLAFVLLTCLLMRSEIVQQKAIHIKDKNVPSFTEKNGETLAEEFNPSHTLLNHQNDKDQLITKLKDTVEHEALTLSKFEENAIPKRVHQTWKTNYVPQFFKDWILSWQRHNPEWEYWFWTDDDIATMISTKHPKFVQLFDSYRYGINRADAIRYFILYEYGGVYADLDVENLKPLGGILTNFDCVLGQEPDVHTYLVHKRIKSFASNAFMACRPRHPFFEQVIDHLIYASTQSGLLGQTGPFMLDDVAQKYIGNHTGHMNKDSLILIQPELFLPTYDPLINKPPEQDLMRKCSKILSGTFVEPAIANKPDLFKKTYYQKQKEVCKQLDSKQFANEPLESSLCNHYWVHSYWYSGKYNGKNTPNNTDISKLVPNVKKWSDGLMNNTISLEK